MRTPNNISDEAADALVELCFACLAPVDPDALAAFLGAVLRIVEREVRRAAADERRRAIERVRTPCRN
jgi:hypothetical protein